MTDQGFPIIEYPPGASPRDWGLMHGETFRDGIHELFEIRYTLMQEKNPALSPDDISGLAAEQWLRTEQCDADLAAELQGICDGAALSHKQIVVLNNYTDFRDIHFQDEGCSSVFVNRGAGPIVGQTWDMHRSAKNYVCCLRIPGEDADVTLFSLVGCVGMMGFTSHGTMVGVNNLNTSGAVPGVLWPVLVRKTLQLPTPTEMASYLTTADVTSGHNYLVASPTGAEMWEVLPGLSERVDKLADGEQGCIFHTNHCLGEQAQHRELGSLANSTTHVRFELLQKKVDDVRTFDDVYDLLNDHENYPQSICSNFQSTAHDPSATCGGAVGDLNTGRVTMWRGDAEYDDNFVRHEFRLATV